MSNLCHPNAPLGACVAGPTKRSVLDPTVVVNFLKLRRETDVVPESLRANHAMYGSDPANPNLASL